MNFFQNTCKPEGLGGKLMAATMNMGGHAALASWGLSHLVLRDDLDILEIGCGGGANVAELLKRCPGGTVVGVEKRRRVNAGAIQAGFSRVAVHRNRGKHWTCFIAEQ